MKRRRNYPRCFLACGWLLTFCLLAMPLRARPKDSLPSPPPLYVFLIDQFAPQGAAPAFNGLDERRRGPLFAAALQQVSRDGKLPRLTIINQDLSLPATVSSEPKVPPGATLVRLYLNQWSQTVLGGVADTEILCRLYVQTLRDGKVTRELGPFFARQRLDPTNANLPAERWAQYQAVARQAIEKMAATLRTEERRPR